MIHMTIPQMNVHNDSSHNYPNSHHHMYNPSHNTQSHSNPSVPTISNVKVPKSRKKRKPNDLNTSFEDDAPTKPRKRKSMLYKIHYFSKIISISLQKKVPKKQKNLLNILCNNYVIYLC